MNKIKKLTALFLCALLTFPFAPDISAQTGDTSVSSSAEAIDGDSAKRYINEAASIILSKYKFDITKEELYKSALEKILAENPALLESAFDGMLDGLDQYSVYYTEEELNGFLDGLSGEVCGIGVLVTADEKGLVIANVYDNTPAKDAGLMMGDIITHAGGVFLGGMDIELAKSNIVGPEGTSVTIRVSRNGKSEDKTLTRRRVSIDSGFYQLVENDTIGYINLTEFSATACEFIEKALGVFDEKGIKNVIMDLRNNPGGGLTELVDVCSLFIPTGPAIHLEYKNPLKFFTLSAYNKNETPKYNVFVLINENSASASEAFSAAVQDTGVGIVIGEKSFGKGTMQNITLFKIGGGMKLTEAVYLSPDKREVNGVGVTPDVVAPDKKVPYEKSDLVPMSYERKLKLGDTGSDVRAIEERLRLLGLSVGVPDDVFDEKTKLATFNLQKATGLYPYGVMDFTTQAKIETLLNGNEIKNDTSYKKAVEIIQEGKWKDYRKFFSE